MMNETEIENEDENKNGYENGTGTGTDIVEFTEPSDETVLNIKNLTSGYGETVVISDVNLHIDDSEIVCLIGPNGAGKSTVMKSVYGFATVHSGTVTYRNENITRLSPGDSLTAGMAYVLQESSIFPRMTVTENLMMGGFILNDDDRVRELVEETYEEFDRLSESRDQKARTLSGGERRLLEIARALILDPDLLFLDEPSIGLEPRYIEMVFDRITELRDAGKTLMLVEQNAEKGLSVADRGYVLADGQIRYEGTGEQLLDDEQVGELYLGG
jgi:branched-chain amino acid transport system ATP-binding protein